jgi:hypothetical protein
VNDSLILIAFLIFTVFFYSLRLHLIRKLNYFWLGDDIAHFHFYKMISSGKRSLDNFTIGTIGVFNYHLLYHRIVDFLSVPFRALKYSSVLLYLIFSASLILISWKGNIFTSLVLVFPFFLWSTNRNTVSFSTYTERIFTVILANILMYFHYLYYVAGENDLWLFISVYFVLFLCTRISMFGVQYVLFVILPINFYFLILNGNFRFFVGFVIFLGFALLFSKTARIEVLSHYRFLRSFNLFYGIKKLIILNRLRDYILVLDLIVEIGLILFLNLYDIFYLLLLFQVLVVNFLVIFRPFYRVGEGYRYILLSFLVINYIYLIDTEFYFFVPFVFWNIVSHFRKMCVFKSNHSELEEIANYIRDGDIVFTHSYRFSELVSHFLDKRAYESYKCNSFRYYEKNEVSLKYFSGKYPYFELEKSWLLTEGCNCLIVPLNYRFSWNIESSFKRVHTTSNYLIYRSI